MTLNRVRILSPNYSIRNGTVRLIVLHTAEGALSYQSLGSFFGNPSSGVSSHVGIDDTPNTVGEYVDRGFKAWTAANANPVAVQAELCAFASWSVNTWNAHGMMLSNTAQWIAEEAAFFGVPIVKLTPQQAQTNGRGVCQHSDLGVWGGGHTDCGPSFPIDRVLSMASGSSQPPQTIASGDDMICVDPKTNGVWVIASKEGAVNSYDGAPYLGGTNNNAMNADRYPCVGIGPWKDGYVIVLDWGENPGDRFRRYHFPRNGSGKVSSGTY